MPNIITEVLDDGTIYSFDTELCEQMAEETLEALWEKEDKVINYDYTCTVYNLFLDAIHILSQSGWSTEDLLNEVCDHTEAEDMRIDDDDDEDYDDEKD